FGLRRLSTRLAVAKLLRGRAHPVAELLSGKILRRLARRRQPLRGLLQAVEAIGEPFLLGGQPPPRVARAAAFAIEPLGLVGDPLLRLRDLLRLELQIAERAPLRIRRSVFHPR